MTQEKTIFETQGMGKRGKKKKNLLPVAVSGKKSFLKLKNIKTGCFYLRP